MLDRVVYISGPSGTGKTYLIRQLMELNPVYIAGNPEKLDRMKHVRNKLATHMSKTIEYSLDKIRERLQQAQFLSELEKLHPGRIILADRCIYDTLSYLKAAHKYGDLTKQDYDNLVRRQMETHPKELYPKHVVFLDFPLQDIKKYLQQRWVREGIGFRENDDKYLGMVSESFAETFKEVKERLDLNRHDERNAAQVDKWIKGRIIL